MTESRTTKESGAKRTAGENVTLANATFTFKPTHKVSTGKHAVKFVATDARGKSTSRSFTTKK